MRYLHTMIRVSDLSASLHFFCELLGMREVRRMESEKGRFTLVFLTAFSDETDDSSRPTPTIELTYNWPDENGQTEQYTGGRNFGHLAYEVDNIYALCEKLMNAGITINRPPRDGNMAFIQTPDGISIELLQKGEKLTPKEPWASMKNSGSW